MAPDWCPHTLQASSTHAWEQCTWFLHPICIYLWSCTTDKITRKMVHFVRHDLCTCGSPKCPLRLGITAWNFTHIFHTYIWVIWQSSSVPYACDLEFTNMAHLACKTGHFVSMMMMMTWIVVIAVMEKKVSLTMGLTVVASIRSPLIVGCSHNSYWIGLTSMFNHSYILICFSLFKEQAKLPKLNIMAVQ